jgi:S1-C subfamily serine protease
MKNFLIRAALAAFFIVASAGAAVADQSAKVRHEQMIYPVVLVQSGHGSGSGTVIFSERHDGEVHTYILTNHHVVANSIKVSKLWCSGPPKCNEPGKIDIERRETVQAIWFEYNDLSRNIGTRGQKADIVAYSPLRDLALLRTRNKETEVQYVAAIMPEDAPTYLGDRIQCVGAGLGNPPFLTSGEVGFLDAEIKGEDSRYALISCPIIFGNSGGAAFRWSDARQQYELQSIPSKVSATWATGPVTHMAWGITMETARKFFREHEMGWVIGDPKIIKTDEGEN